LEREVAVILGRAVLGNLEPIGKRLTGRDRALSNSRYAIVLDAIELAKAVLVDGGTVGLEVVGYIDDEIVSLAGRDQRAWHRPVECYVGSLIPIQVALGLLRGQPDLYGLSGIWDYVVVVGVDAVLALAAARCWYVLAPMLERRDTTVEQTRGLADHSGRGQCQEL
jgi:hypothetical protein